MNYSIIVIIHAQKLEKTQKKIFYDQKYMRKMGKTKKSCLKDKNFEENKLGSALVIEQLYNVA